MSAGQPVNAMSIDVEDYFQVAAFAPYIERHRWDGMECRVERNVALILDLLDRHATKATFFTLGWIAERYPALVKEIVARGHELASHGYGHLRASDQTPDSFREDLAVAKALLEDIGGVAVTGYRAPSFSIGEGNLWAHDVIAETGHRYSSSVYPIAHDHYGMPAAPRFAWRTDSGVVEIAQFAQGPGPQPAGFGRRLTSGYCRIPSRAGASSASTSRTASLASSTPPVGSRSPSAAHRASRREVEIRHYLNLDRMASPRPAAGRLPLGPGRSRLRRTPRPLNRSTRWLPT